MQQFSRDAGVTASEIGFRNKPVVKSRPKARSERMLSRSFDIWRLNIGWPWWHTGIGTRGRYCNKERFGTEPQPTSVTSCDSANIIGHALSLSVTLVRMVSTASA
jgi:hypothetical protein